MNRSNSAADSLRLGIIATGAADHVRKAPAEQIIMFLLRHLKGTARRRQDGAVSPDCQDVLHIPVIHHPAQVVITSTVRQEHRLATGRVFLMRPKKEQCLQPLLSGSSATICRSGSWGHLHIPGRSMAAEMPPSTRCMAAGSACAKLPHRKPGQGSGLLTRHGRLRRNMCCHEPVMAMMTRKNLLSGAADPGRRHRK